MSTTNPLITTVSIPAFHPKIHYGAPILMIGSCFTEHIGIKLDRYKYDVQINPFGILYNPVSLERSMDRIAHRQYYHPDELVMQDGLYHSMDHHGSFSGKNPEKVIQKINNSIDQAYDHLKKSAFIYISPGTSIVYKYKPSGKIAGNCHKISQSAFDHFPLSVDECVSAFEKMYSTIHSLSPDAHIIWTVSPVRHLRDGLIENQRSKSALIVAIEQVIRNHPGTGYFPAYEIMMDQLRDYRYYARDLIHPSDMAVDIIWDIFCAAYLDPSEREYHPAIEKIKKAMEHRWLHEDPDAIKLFARGQLKKIDALATLLPGMHWREERQYFFHLTELD